MPIVYFPVVIDGFAGCPLPFASYVQWRRRQLHLTIAQAAELSGLRFSDWYAIEAGWIPNNPNLLRSIAGTLETSMITIDLLADRQSQHTVA
jgi:hypothetical protein